MAPSEIAQCRADMAAVTAAVDELRRALAAVPPMLGPQTWQGLSADIWAAGWNTRRGRLTALLDQIVAEQSRLIARLENQEKAKVS